MRESGYRTTFHIYLIFFLSLLGSILATVVLFFLLITVQKPDGSTVRSDWPKTLTEDFGEQIVLIGNKPQIKQAGIELLQKNDIGLQILDAARHERFSYHKPAQVSTVYSDAELLRLYQTGHLLGGQTTSFVGMLTLDGSDYTYILHFPMEISIVTMYLNGERFAGGKTVILSIFGVLFLVVLAAGVFYGFRMTRTMKLLISSVQDIAVRSYLPIQNNGAFRDLYDSLNALDEEIRASDRLRTQTEKMREEWIANITHDLKTPLSPIKGYAEILWEDDGKEAEKYRKYAGVILKNAAYMETLIDDLKLTYQLENDMLPIKHEEQNIVRFLKELVISILNTPEYESRTIHFESTAKTILCPFDQTLLTRAFRNLIINAFVHGEAHTEVSLQVSTSDNALQINVADNGKGMSAEEMEHLFDRYFRGASTEQKPEGTGLGLAITKSIVELHAGHISVSSTPNVGTIFQIEFPPVKVN